LYSFSSETIPWELDVGFVIKEDQNETCWVFRERGRTSAGGSEVLLFQSNI
jgi:hypothetical protein